MGTYQDPLQRAVVCILTVMGALRNSAFNAFVSMAAHNGFLLFVDSKLVFAQMHKI